MGLLKKIAGFLGLANHDDHEVKENNDDDDGDNNNVNRAPQNQAHFRDSGLPRKGFSVPVQVAVDRPIPGPIIIPCRPGDGGVQGLKWHAKRLKMDEDGDVADEFLDEIFPDMSVSSENRKVSRFEVKSRTRPAKVKHQVLSRDGRIQLRVDYQGGSMWVDLSIRFLPCADKKCGTLKPIVLIPDLWGFSENWFLQPKSGN